MVFSGARITSFAGHIPGILSYISTITFSISAKQFNDEELSTKHLGFVPMLHGTLNLQYWIVYFSFLLCKKYSILVITLTAFCDCWDELN